MSGDLLPGSGQVLHLRPGWQRPRYRDAGVHVCVCACVCVHAQILLCIFALHIYVCMYICIWYIHIYRKKACAILRSCVMKGSSSPSRYARSQDHEYSQRRPQVEYYFGTEKKGKCGPLG